MLSNDLLSELHKLNRVEKLRVVQLLVNELATEEESSLIANAEYEIFTPYGNEAAAQTLFEALKAAEEADKKAN